MSEAIISRRGSSVENKPYTYHFRQFYKTQFFYYPEDLLDNKIDVILIGGGGAGMLINGGYQTNTISNNGIRTYYCGGGGSGWVNHAEVTLNQNTNWIYVTIGTGGQVKAGYSSDGLNGYMKSGTGGTSSFGSYLSANGGTGPNLTHAGSGGAGGGGGPIVIENAFTGMKWYANASLNGGHGYQFGGGGGCGLIIDKVNNKQLCPPSNGGNGGTYGGGGAAVCFLGMVTTHGGTGGRYGGNGGTSQFDYPKNNVKEPCIALVKAEDGTNTYPIFNDGGNIAQHYYSGTGRCGNGGYHSSFADLYSGVTSNSNIRSGGGGGYGGVGGSYYAGMTNDVPLLINNKWVNCLVISGAGGGGGWANNYTWGGFAAYTPPAVGWSPGFIGTILDLRGVIGGGGGEGLYDGGGYGPSASDPLSISPGWGGGYYPIIYENNDNSLGRNIVRRCGYGGGNTNMSGSDGACIIQYYSR